MSRFTSKILLAVALINALAFAAWDGSVKQPNTVTVNDTAYYEINTPEELMGFMELFDKPNGVTLNAILKSDILFGDDSLAVSKIKWERDGKRANNYGVIDGNGKTIYGLNASNSLFAGVFGTVKNLTLANSEIGGDTAQYVGGLVSYNAGVIENVEVRDSKIKSVTYAGGVVAEHSYSNLGNGSLVRNVRSVRNAVYGNAKVGGVIGYSTSLVENAYSSSNVYVVNSQESFYGLSCVGGVIGEHYATSRAGTYDLRNMENVGDVYAEHDYDRLNVGGIVGYSYWPVKFGKNSGNVYAKSTKYAFVGGIAGKLYRGDVENVVNTGNITGVANDSVFAGGIIGELFDANTYGAKNTGKVLGTATQENALTLVGGFAGYLENRNSDGTFTKIANYGDVESESGYNAYAGGLIGLMRTTFYSANYNRLELFESFNYGNVLARNNVDAIVEAGGIVAMVDNASIGDVYNRGAVVGESLGDSWNYAGGLVGKMYSNRAKLKNAYSASKKIEGNKVGGTVAYLRYSGPVENLYSDATLLDIPVLGDSLVAIETVDLHNSSTGEMQSDAFVLNLNTENGTVEKRNVWMRNGGYPCFEFDTIGCVGADTISQDTVSQDTVLCDSVNQDTSAQDSSKSQELVIRNVRLQNKNVVVDGLNILVVSGEFANVVVFNLQGNVIARAKGKLVTLQVPSTGAYIVRVNDSFKQIVVR